MKQKDGSKQEESDGSEDGKGESNLRQTGNILNNPGQVWKTSY